MICAGLLMAAGLGVGAWRVVELESQELDFTSDWRPLEPTAAPGAPEKLQPHRELGRVELTAGEDVTFEVCSRDRLEPDHWAEAGVTIAVWMPETQRVVAHQPLDRGALSQASRGPRGACLVIASGAELEHSGRYAVEAVWDEALPPALAGTLLHVRVLAFSPAQLVDRWPVVLILAGALLLVFAFVGPVEEGAPEVDRPVMRLALGVSSLLIGGVALSMIPLGGSAGGLARALGLASLQVILVISLVRPGAEGGRRAALGLTSPQQGLWVFGVALLVGLALWALGQLPLRLVPATSESAVGALVSWPSGSLAVALVSVLSPLAEEFFFRGFVYGTAARRWGAARAFVVTVVLFALVHLPQAWGAWGGLLAVAITGVGLTALRAWTGTTLAPAVAHLVHNSAITLLWVFVARG